MIGKLYGIGIGPGDPELMTLKASRVLSDCEYLAVPGKHPKDTVAYTIVEKLDQTVDMHLSEKTVLGIHMPMTKDKKNLEDSHRQAMEEIVTVLKQGKDVAFLTLGDPTIYSTYMYVHEKVAREGYEVEIINGISSFLSAAGKVGLHLGSKEEQIHIIPASYEIEEALHLPGTKIFMKAGREYVRLRNLLQQKKDATVIMVENCCMKEEAIYRGAEQLPEQAGYYTIVFVKDGK